MSKAQKIIVLIFVAALVVCISCSPGRAIWDELYYLFNCRELLEKGFSLSFLRESKISTGPLFAVVYALPVQLSNGNVHVARALNVGLWVGVALIACGLRSENMDKDPMSTASFIFGPMAWPSLGLAMTESVTLIPFLGSAVVASTSAIWRNHRYFASATCGLLLGIAVCGRQLMLVALPFLCLLVWRQTKRFDALLVTGLTTVALPVVLFWVWHGLISPQMHHVGGTRIDLSHSVLALAFVGIATIFIDYRLLWRVSLPIVIGEAAIAGLCMVLLRPQFMPLPWLLGNSEVVRFAFDLGCCWFAVHAAVCFLSLCIEKWENGSVVFAASAVLLLAFSACAVASQFSTRYVVVTLPLISVLAGTTLNSPTLGVVAANAVGSCLGVGILLHYYAS